nr:zinc-dependent alcohol dehydrogenase family protein [Paenibacillus daejeonensis]
MQRVIYERFGDPQAVLQVTQAEVPELRSGELLVRMLARPINPSDLIPIRGNYAHRIQLPAIPGYEGVGMVVDAADAANRDMIGQRVLPLRGEGTWQEYVRVPAATTIEVPTALSDEMAAQAYINPLTAWVSCTDTLNLGVGDYLVANACGSALGRIYAQLSRLLGFQLIAVVRDSLHAEELRRLGAAHVIVADDQAAVSEHGAEGRARAGGSVLTISDSASDLAEIVREITGGAGATAAIDSVGGASGAALAGCVRPGGQLLTIGLLSGQAVPWAEVAARTDVRVGLFHLRHWNNRVTVQRWRTELERLLGWMAQGKLELPMPGDRYALNEVNRAVKAAEAPGSGKILLI